MRSTWRAANVRETPIETRDRLADIWLDAVEAMMDSEISASKGIIETLRERLAELEHLEASGASTPDTHEELVDIHEFLDRLYTMSLEHSSQTLHSHVWRN
jgi:hypothetical protein